MALQIWFLVPGLMNVASTMLVLETKDKTKEYKEVSRGKSDQSINSLTTQ